MKIPIKVFFAFLIYLSISQNGLAQIGSLQKDTLTLNRKDPKADSKEQRIKGYDIEQSGKTGNNAGSIKQVKSARPDMSKARGARPPDIVRPSGSRIPNGIGRPAGAVRPGHG
jgi:hypothetical protein